MDLRRWNTKDLDKSMTIGCVGLQLKKLVKHGKKIKQNSCCAPVSDQDFSNAGKKIYPWRSPMNKENMFRAYYKRSESDVNLVNGEWKTLKVTLEKKEKLGLSVKGNRPVLISQVKRGGQADRVGLETGDAVYAIGGIKVYDATATQVANLIRYCKNKLVIEVRRPRRIVEGCSKSSIQSKSQLSTQKSSKMANLGHHSENGKPSARSPLTTIYENCEDSLYFSKARCAKFAYGEMRARYMQDAVGAEMPRKAHLYSDVDSGVSSQSRDQDTTGSQMSRPNSESNLSEDNVSAKSQDDLTNSMPILAWLSACNSDYSQEQQDEQKDEELLYENIESSKNSFCTASVSEQSYETVLEHSRFVSYENVSCVHNRSESRKELTPSSVRKRLFASDDTSEDSRDSQCDSFQSRGETVGHVTQDNKQKFSTPRYHKSTFTSVDTPQLLDIASPDKSVVLSPNNYSFSDDSHLAHEFSENACISGMQSSPLNISFAGQGTNRGDLKVKLCKRGPRWSVADPMWGYGACDNEESFYPFSEDDEFHELTSSNLEQSATCDQSRDLSCDQSKFFQGRISDQSSQNIECFRTRISQSDLKQESFISDYSVLSSCIDESENSPHTGSSVYDDSYLASFKRLPSFRISSIQMSQGSEDFVGKLPSNLSLEESANLSANDSNLQSQNETSRCSETDGSFYANAGMDPVLSCEDKYVAFMSQAIGVYSRPLRFHKVLMPEQYTAIFQNIERLASISQFIGANLRHSQELTPRILVHIYQSKMELLTSCYSSYIEGLPHALDVLNQLDSNQDWLSFIETQAKLESTDIPTLESFLWMPLCHIIELYGEFQKLYTAMQNSDDSKNEFRIECRDVVEKLESLCSLIQNTGSEDGNDL